MSRYLKAIIAFIVTAATWAGNALADGKVSSAEAYQLIGVVVATLGVYLVPNNPPTGQANPEQVLQDVPEVAPPA